MIHRVKVAKGGPSINYLLFAVDDIIFCRAKVREWLAIQKVLDIYKAAAGQGINKQKTRTFFNSTAIMQSEDTFFQLWEFPFVLIRRSILVYQWWLVGIGIKPLKS